MILVRQEQPDDVAAIRRVNEQAFGQPEEAGIVDTLRRSTEGLLSLVAVAGDQVEKGLGVSFEPVMRRSDIGQ